MNSEPIAISGLLKEARKSQGLTIKAVARDICVRSTYLKAIENGEYDKLPAQTFAVGFVRSYANMLGEDPDKIVASFKKECGIEKPTTLEIQPEILAKTPPKARKNLPAWLSPLAGLIGVSLSWIVLGGGIGSGTMTADAGSEIASEVAHLEALQSDIKQSDIGLVSASETNQQLVVAAKAVTQDDQTEVSTVTSSQSLFIPAAYASNEAPVAAARSDLLLEATEDSWVRIARADGTELWSGILRAGQTYRPHEAGTLLLTTSNAGGLKLNQNGAETAILGARGEIVTDHPLVPSSQLSAGGSGADEGVRSR
jgi:cytoskeleton protein RodZ